MSTNSRRSFGLTIDLDALVYEANSEFQHILVAETAEFGRVLLLDGDLQSAQADEAIYHESFVHPAVLAHGAVRSVLVAGAGEGAVLRELLRHSGIERVVAVDIDREAVQACREHLPAWSAGAFDDPRVELYFEDIEHTLARAKTAGDRFDLIVSDLTDLSEGGPAEHHHGSSYFRRLSQVLAPGGLVVAQGGEVDPWGMDHARHMFDALGEVFASVALSHFFVPSFLNLWGAYLCAAEPDFEFVPGDLDDRVGALHADTFSVYDAAWHRACLHLPRLFALRLANPRN